MCLLFFDPKKFELDNHISTFIEIESRIINKDYKIQYIILSDNPNLDKQTIEYISSRISGTEILFIPTNKNGARVKTIIDNLSLVKGKFLKSIDPDDLLIPVQTINFIDNFLIKAKDKSLTIYSYNAVYQKIYFNEIDSINNKVFFRKRSFNPNSVYPTKILRKLNWNFKFLIWSDDLLGFLLVKNGAKVIYKPEYHFYLNQRHAGVSTTKNSHNSMKFTNDSLKFLDIANIEINSKKDEKNFRNNSGKPNVWFFERYCEDSIFNNKLTNEEKIKYIEKIYIKIEDYEDIKLKFESFLQFIF